MAVTLVKVTGFGVVVVVAPTTINIQKKITRRKADNENSFMMTMELSVYN